MMNNIAVFGADICSSEMLAKALAHELKYKLMKLDDYIEYTLGRDSHFVVDNLGKDYYFNIASKAIATLETFEKAVVAISPKTLAGVDGTSLWQDFILIYIDCAIAKSNVNIDSLVKANEYLLVGKKGKIKENMRILKNRAQIIIKYGELSDMLVGVIDNINRKFSEVTTEEE